MVGLALLSALGIGIVMLVVPDLRVIFRPARKGRAVDARVLRNLFRYRKHRFARLNEMVIALRARGLSAMAGPWPAIDGRSFGPTGKRELAAIRRELRFLGIAGGVDCAATFVRYTAYSVPAAGYAGGFYYTETEPINFFIDESPIREKPFDDCEEIRYPEYGPYIVYIRLCDHWYLFEAYED